MNLLESIVYIGEQLKTLKQSSPQGLEKYVQSRGTGLITNGSGLLGNNTNFSQFSFDPTESKVGLGCFVCDKVNADVGIDELIPINPLDTYKVEFWAKYDKGSEQGGNYFYVGAYDADGNAIIPPHFTDSTFKIERFVKGEKTITIHADDRQRFFDTLNTRATAGTQFLSPNGYTAQTGFVYPPNTYQRNAITVNRTFKQLNYNKDTGVLSNTYCYETFESGTVLPLAVAGETYAYIMPQMRYNSKLTEEWQYFSVSFKPSELNSRFAYASFIKIGWLLNRGVASGTTKICGVNLRG